MKSLKKNLLKILSLTVLITLFVACNDDDGSQKMEGPANIIVRLTDAPGDYDAVNIDVQDVMVQYEEDGPWESIGEINTGVYNLLELTGGVNVVLADNEIPSGMVRQIRLVLGNENSIVVDGEEIHLDTPSAQESGLKLQLNQELETGFTYDFTIDFDADKSIVSAGNSGKYLLKPVLKLSAEVSSGIITGTVEPADFQSMAWVIVEEDTISAYTDDNGVFMLYGVPGGTYTVMVTPDPEFNYEEGLVEEVEVINGDITDIGVVTLEEITTGSISGKILNEGISATISVEVPVEGNEEGQVETVSTTTAEDGSFILEDLPAGTYTVTITPDGESGLTETTVADVEVTIGETISIGEITLE